MAAKKARTKARKPDRREAYNYECMSRIIKHAQAYLDGIDSISPTVYAIYEICAYMIDDKRVTPHFEEH